VHNKVHINRELVTFCVAMVKLQDGIEYEDRLEGLSNHSPWKERIKLVLQVNMI